MDYGALLGDFGARHTITWRGKEYPVAFITAKSKAAFEAWVKKGKLTAARALRDEGASSEQEYEADRDRVLADAAAGLYQFGGPHTLRELARKDGSGMFQLLLILMRECDPALTESDVRALMAEEPGQVADVVDLIRVTVEARVAGLEKKAAGARGSGPPPTLPASAPA